MTAQEQLARDVIFKRRLLKLNQTELARGIGSSQTAIARIEKAHGNPTVDFVQRLADVLELDIQLNFRPIRRKMPSGSTKANDTI